MTIDVTKEAREILNRHCEYMDGLDRGQVLMKTSNALAAVVEALSRPSALSVGEEDALTAWVTKIALEGEVAAKDGLEFGDLVRAFRAGFRAAIAAMNGGGE